MEEKLITLTFADGTVKRVPVGTRLLELVPEFSENFSRKIVVAKVNNNYQTLNFCLQNDSAVQFFDASSKAGLRIYSQSGVFLLVKAAEMVFPGLKVKIEHALGHAIYGEMQFSDGRKLTEDDLKRIEEQMQQLVQAKLPFNKIFVTREGMINSFLDRNCPERVSLLRYGIRDTIGVYECDGFIDNLSGYLVPDTGYIDDFCLKMYASGFLLQGKDEKVLDLKMKKQKNLFHIYHESKEWQKILQVSTIGDLNDQIVKRKISNLICVAEAFHEKKIARIADLIADNREKLRIVLISGPSSSGKTTFAQRLSIQMLINGLRPVSISLDDYFVDRENTPLDEFGEPDFEALETIDLNLFNEQLTSLIAGEEVELPTFNFKLGKREYLGKKLKINQDQPLIIEGIHALNNRLTSAIPRENKFNVYISALTQVNLDDHNRIPTTDARLIRRIVRDSQFRGLSALDTLCVWPSVRRGEEKNIFPFQDQADVMFNSSLIYELAVLKKYAEPLLLEISSDAPQYGEARRLIKLLSYVLSIPDQDIPATSILREFIGQSFFFSH